MKPVLLSLKLKVSKSDPSIFYYYKNNKLLAIVADDFLWAGDVLFSKDIIAAISKIFVIGKIPKNVFHYLGLELNQNIHNKTLGEAHCINLLQSLNQKLINNRNTISDIVQSAVGKLLWVCGQTRPDISFEVSKLATNIKKFRWIVYQKC